jgi:hypothetical protein
MIVQVTLYCSLMMFPRFDDCLPVSQSHCHVWAWVFLGPSFCQVLDLAFGAPDLLRSSCVD